MNKLDFLKNDFVNILATIDSNTPPVFGKMNVHQMIEHMGYAFKQASGLIPLEATNDEETTQKMYRFMISEKPFKDNTPNPYLPDEPAPTQCETVIESLDFLQKDIDHFAILFEKEPEKKFMNPFFGLLNFEEWTHLLHKHALHHLRQFSIQTLA